MNNHAGSLDSRDRESQLRAPIAPEGPLLAAGGAARAACVPTYRVVGGSGNGPAHAAFAPSTDGDKQDAIRLMTGGIAHNFGNLLQIIEHSISLIEDSLADQDPHRAYCSLVKRSVERAANLIEELSGFQRDRAQPGPVNLHDAVVRSSQAVLREQGEVAWEGADAERSWPISLNQVRLEAVLERLLENARQAMTDGGTIHVSASEVAFPHDAGQAPTNLLPGRYLRITVADTGVGMSEDVQRRIFDPFFTTQGFGLAAGLGLTSALAIVHNAGGTISVDSAAGKGSAIHVYVPNANADLENPAA